MDFSFLFAWFQANPWALLFAVLAPYAINFTLQSIFSGKAVKAVFLDPNSFQPLKLVEKKKLSHNTYSLRFALQTRSQRLGLPIGQHITFLAKDDSGTEFYRPYTPTSDDDLIGAVEFVIKTYPTGKMSQVVTKMELGETMMMKGPKGRFKYTPNSKDHIGLVAGGSGITPMFQVAQGLLKNPKDKTSLSLIFANVTEEDILLRAELDALKTMHGDRFKLFYVLSSPHEGWTGGAGYVTADMMKDHLPAPGPRTLVLRCGPPPMNAAVQKNLESLGYAADELFQF